MWQYSKTGHFKSSQCSNHGQLLNFPRFLLLETSSDRAIIRGIIPNVLPFFVVLCLFLKGVRGVETASWLIYSFDWNLLCSPCWPLTCRDHSGSTFWVLGLEACATMANLPEVLWFISKCWRIFASLLWEIDSKALHSSFWELSAREAEVGNGASQWGRENSGQILGGVWLFWTSVWSMNQL